MLNRNTLPDAPSIFKRVEMVDKFDEWVRTHPDNVAWHQHVNATILDGIVAGKIVYLGDGKIQLTKLGFDEAPR